MDLTNLKQINDSKAEKALLDKNHQELLSSAINVSNTVLSATESLIKYLEGHTSKTQVVNQLKSINTPDALRVIPFLEKLDKTLQTHKNTDLTEITAVMKGILEEAKKIPKEIPKEKEQQFVDYTKQFISLGDAVKSVEKVVKAQKLIAEAPIVNVPQTKVNVEAPNLKPLQKNIEEVVKAVNNIVIPEYKTDNTAVEELIKKSNKLLKEIVDKPVSQGGGGGGRATPYQNTSSIPIFPNAVVSTATPTITAVAVVNPDGTNIAGGGAGGALNTQAKGATAAGYPTSTTASADRQLLDVTLRDTSGAAVAVGGGTQYADGAAKGTSTGTIVMGDDGTLIQAITAKTLSTQVVSTDTGLVVNAVMHGLTTAGGGSYVDVKVNPSGALSVDASGSTLAANSGVDIGDVTINNATGASAVNIQDGGNSITVDGTIAVSTNSELGIVTETAPATDTASSGLNGRLQRIAQRLTSLITALGSPFQAGGSIGNTSFAATQATGTNLHTVVDSGNIAVTGSVTATLASTTITGTVAVTDNSGSLTVDAPVATPVFVRLSDGAAAITTLPVSLTSTTVTGTVTTKETRSTTNTTATVAGSATVVTLIASNANRLGATVYNDSSAILYVKLGATASTTDFTVALSPLTSSIGGYFEVPFAYTGIITGIWASATGSARVGEIV